jgi:diguanylate cyclase (GGDEF)-like protein
MGLYQSGTSGNARLYRRRTSPPTSTTARTIERATRLDLSAAILAIDLDRFKAVNDSGGHAAGDIVLRRVAEVLSKTVRHPDVIAYVAPTRFFAPAAKSTYLSVLASFPDGILGWRPMLQ